MATSKALIPPRVESRIVTIRDERVILDRDLADIYGVPTKALNQAVKRNEDRFPDDFVFRLTTTEFTDLKSQFVTSNPGRGGTRKPPLAFTEHGAIMAATILNSPRAVEMSIFVVRAFVRIRELAEQHSEIARRLTALEQKVAGHDTDLQEMFAALRSLLSPPHGPKRRIGFSGDDDKINLRTEHWSTRPLVDSPTIRPT